MGPQRPDHYLHSPLLSTAQFPLASLPLSPVHSHSLKHAHEFFALSHGNPSLSWSPTNLNHAIRGFASGDRLRYNAVP